MKKKKLKKKKQPPPHGKLLFVNRLAACEQVRTDKRFTLSDLKMFAKKRALKIDGVDFGKPESEEDFLKRVDKNNPFPAVDIYSRDEDELAKACMQLFWFQHPSLRYRLFHIPNEGERSEAYGKELKDKGMLPGVWDYFLSVPQRDKGGLFIETKTKNNKLTIDQVIFMEANKEDYDFAVVRTTYEWEDAINGYLSCTVGL